MWWEEKHGSNWRQIVVEPWRRERGSLALILWLRICFQFRPICSIDVLSLVLDLAHILEHQGLPKKDKDTPAAAAAAYPRSGWTDLKESVHHYAGNRLGRVNNVLPNDSHHPGRWRSSLSEIGKTFSCGFNTIIDSKPPLHPNNHHVKCSHAPCLSVQSIRFTEYHVAQRTKFFYILLLIALIHSSLAEMITASW